jgi:hypothetical protein
MYLRPMPIFAALLVVYLLDVIQVVASAGFCSSLCLAILAPVPWPKWTYPTLSQFQNQSLGWGRDVIQLVLGHIDVIRVVALVGCNTSRGTCLAASIQNISAVHRPSRAPRRRADLSATGSPAGLPLLHRSSMTDPLISPFHLKQNFESWVLTIRAMPRTWLARRALMVFNA